MRTFVVAITALILSIQPSTAQWWGQKTIKGNGEYTTETRELDPYDKIEVAGNLDVTLVSGKEGSLLVQAESNLMEYLITETKGDRLKIYIKRGVNLHTSSRMGIKIQVPFDDISAVSLAGSGDIESSDKIIADRLEINLSGSGDIELTVEAREVRSNISGSGDIELKGQAEDFEASLKGSGDMAAYELEAKRVDASVTGSGDMEVYASEEIKAVVIGSGDISFKGNPQRQDTNAVGSGRIAKQ